jgi:AraC family transcriptional regulator
MRHIGPYPEIGGVFAKLGPWTSERNVPKRGALAIFYDDPNVVEASKLRSDACVVVPEDYSLDAEGISLIDMPAGKFAVGKYVGPYSGLPGAWGDFMGEWFPSSGLEIGEGFCYEQYMNDPQTTEPAKLETLLFMPVR